MATRYTIKKWWSMKEDPEGQYVAYHEHQEALDALRYENDKLWERIAQQVKEFDDLKKDRNEWIAKNGEVWSENRYLRSDIETMKIIATGLVTMLVIATGFIGVLKWR